MQVFVRLFTLFLLVTVATEINAQVRAFDKLEILYDQGHYSMVYRRANRLLDKPDYDYSLQPEFYKSLAMFHLSRQEFWSQIHPNALQDARKLFIEVKSSPDGMKVFNAHIDHVTEVKKYLTEWSKELKRTDQDKYDELQQILFGLFDNVPDLDNIEYETPVVPDGGVVAEESAAMKKRRDEMVDYAKKQLGVPYVWAGTDPSGFDCSGFTSYVMKNFKKEVPRRAEDQYKSSKKIKQSNAQKGDLVFFNNGSGVSHVGMIISEKGQPLTMIHASSSKGITITDIEASEYWLKRLYGFGTYVE
ncbi:MAG TPA: C40 family peptidase [Fluviicola sp.]|nr:C40 family peptidase [Fluviicola sp.]